MKITPQLFEAFLHCPTKCWLRSTGESGTGNAYAEWLEGQNGVNRAAGIEWLCSKASSGEYVISPPANSLKEAKWRLAFDVRVETEKLESRIHAVERIPSGGRGKPAQFIPVRFISRNKLTKEDKLLLVFDAMVLSEVLGREVGFGRIVHGEDHATLKVKTGAPAGVRKTKDSIAAFLSTSLAPDLVLNRHCSHEQAY